VNENWTKKSAVAISVPATPTVVAGVECSAARLACAVVAGGNGGRARAPATIVLRGKWARIGARSGVHTDRVGASRVTGCCCCWCATAPEVRRCAPSRGTARQRHAATGKAQHAAAWETHAATQAAERVLAYAGRMDAAVTAATAPPPAALAPDDGLTEAERNVRDVMAGRRTKTIRQIVDTAATSTTRADRGQVGNKHDRGRGGPRR